MSVEEVVSKLIEEKKFKDDPKCWICATVTKSTTEYNPNICLDCLPGYRERKFVFVRPSQEEMEQTVRETDAKTNRRNKE